MKLFEPHLAERGSKAGAGDDAEQYRDVGNETPRESRDQKDQHQHEQRDAEAFEPAVVGVGKGHRLAVDHAGQVRQAAAGPVDADAHQRDADHEDDGAGDDRREQRQEPADEGGDDHAEDAGNDHRAVNAKQTDARVRGHGEHRSYGGERHAHHHRQANADARKAHRLDQGGNAARQQVRIDEDRDLLRGQLEGAADDQRHGDCAGVHHEHMLQAKGEELMGRFDAVDFAPGNGRHVRLSLVCWARPGFGRRRQGRRDVRLQKAPPPEASPGGGGCHGIR